MKKSLVMVMVVAALFTMSYVASAADVAVLISDYTKGWYEEVSWDFDAEMNVMRDILDMAEISFVELTDKDLAEGKFGDAKTLILPNNRRMDVNQVAATRAFLEEGGTLLTMMQSSFKNEKNETVDGKIFQLSDEMGLDYEAFGWKPPLHGYIQTTDHPIFEGLPEFIQFHRNWAMIVKHHDDANVIAEWYNDDQIMPSHLPEINAAIIENKEGNILYVGEMLFMEVHIADPQVRTLLTNMVNYLVENSER